MAQASESLAAGLLKRPELDDTGRVQRLYVKAYGRNATPKEVARAQALLSDLERALLSREPDGEKRRLQCWALLCQAVLAANEFVYIR